MAADTATYMQTLQHKLITYIGGTSAVYQLRDQIVDWTPDFISNNIPDWLSDLFFLIVHLISNFEFIEFLSGLAVLLLVIERIFINLIKYRAWRRGD
jgi:hypothetical protein